MDFPSRTPDHEARAATSQESRPSGGAVFGVSVVFLVIAALLVQLTSMGVGKIEADELVRELFGEGGIPAGFELERASRLYTGEDVLELARAYDLEEDPEQPVSLVFILYKSPVAVGALFDPRQDKNPAPEPGPEGEGEANMDERPKSPSERMVAWERDPSFEWHTVIESDDIAWGVWKTRYRIERAFEKGGDWRDSIRIDLSNPKKGRVLFVQWPENRPVNMQALRRLLAHVKVEQPEEAG